MAEEYTYEQLKHMTVAQLREIAQSLQHAALDGYSTMHKEKLLPALCQAMNIHLHHAAQGAEKLRIKARIRELKARRDEALASRAVDTAAKIRRQLHTLKRKLRRMAATTS